MKPKVILALLRSICLFTQLGIDDTTRVIQQILHGFLKSLHCFVEHRHLGHGVVEFRNLKKRQTLRDERKERDGEKDARDDPPYCESRDQNGVYFLSHLVPYMLCRDCITDPMLELERGVLLGKAHVAFLTRD